MDIDWDITAEVAAASGTQQRATSRVIKLIDEGNTLPFIARYRKEATGNMDPDYIRLIKSKLTAYRFVKNVSSSHNDFQRGYGKSEKGSQATISQQITHR